MSNNQTPISKFFDGIKLQFLGLTSYYYHPPLAIFPFVQGIIATIGLVSFYVFLIWYFHEIPTLLQYYGGRTFSVLAEEFVSKNKIMVTILSMVSLCISIIIHTIFQLAVAYTTASYCEGHPLGFVESLQQGYNKLRNILWIPPAWAIILIAPLSLATNIFAQTIAAFVFFIIKLFAIFIFPIIAFEEANIQLLHKAKKFITSKAILALGLTIALPVSIILMFFLSQFWVSTSLTYLLGILTGSFIVGFLMCLSIWCILGFALPLAPPLITLALLVLLLSLVMSMNMDIPFTASTAMATIIYRHYHHQSIGKFKNLL